MIKNLVIRPSIEVNFTTSQWELYTSSMDCNHVACYLNQALQNSVNEGLSKDEVRKAVQVIQNKYAEYGAADTEPRYFLELILDEVFGE